MRAKVVGTLRGSIVLPSIRSTAFEKNAEFDLSNEQYFRPDVQAAFNKKQISIIEGKAPKAVETVVLTNTTTNSLVLGQYGVIRAGQTRVFPVDALSSVDLDRHLKTKALVKKKSSVKEPELEISPVDDKMSAHVYQPKQPKESDKKDVKKKKGVRAKHTKDDSLLLDVIENGVEPGVEDGIQFVDIEQTEQRIANHPRLGNGGK